jgi:hypothetical protein
MSTTKLEEKPRKITDLPGFAAKKYDSKNGKQKRFDSNMLNLMAIDSVPLSIAQGVGFSQLVMDLDSQIVIRSRQTYTNHLAVTVKEEIQPKLRQFLTENSNLNGDVHFSCDIWTNRRRESILGMKYHIISRQWQLESKVLRMLPLNDRHFRSTIREKTEEVLTFYGLSSIHVSII